MVADAVVAAVQVEIVTMLDTHLASKACSSSAGSNSIQEVKMFTAQVTHVAQYLARPLGRALAAVEPIRDLGSSSRSGKGSATKAIQNQVTSATLGSHSNLCLATLLRVVLPTKLAEMQAEGHLGDKANQTLAWIIQWTTTWPAALWGMVVGVMLGREVGRAVVEAVLRRSVPFSLATGSASMVHNAASSTTLALVVAALTQVSPW